MFVLQRIQNSATTYTPFEFRSDSFSDVRSNYGLTQSEYDEFLVVGFFDRPSLFLYVFEGEIPVVEESFSKAAQRALATQKAQLARKVK